MTTAVENSAGPYVGARSFSRKEQGLFYGRDEEAIDLCALIAANSFVVLHAPSGAGKSSLLDAKVVPTLEKRNYSVFAIGRVSGAPQLSAQDGSDPYTRALLGSIEPSTSLERSLTQVLSEKIKETLAARQADQTVESRRASESCRFLLIIDQFEELFTAYPQHWRKREAFLSGLAAALRDNRRLTILVSLREEYVGSLDPLYDELLGLPVAQFALSRLNSDAALVAITEPARRFKVQFAEDALELLMERLFSIKSGDLTGSKAQLGQYAEPVQLQVVCQNVWAGHSGSLIDLPTVQEFGNVQNALGSYYDRCVTEAAAQVKIPQGTLRGWIETRLITDAHSRALVRKTDSYTLGLPNAALEALRSVYLLRDELRGLDTWLELAHDRLVVPIQQSNARWKKEHGIADILRELEQSAASWAGGDSTKGLLRGRRLRRATEFLCLPSACEFGIPAQVKTFVERSQSAAKQRARVFQATAVVLALSAIVLVVLIFARERALNSETSEINAYDDTAGDLENANDSLKPLALAYALLGAVTYRDHVGALSLSLPPVKALNTSLESYGAALRLRPLSAAPSTVSFAQNDQLAALVFSNPPAGSPGGSVWSLSTGRQLWSTLNRVTLLQFSSDSSALAVATLTSTPETTSTSHAPENGMSQFELSILDTKGGFTPESGLATHLACAPNSQLNCFLVSTDLHWVAYPTGPKSIAMVRLSRGKAVIRKYDLQQTALIWASAADVLLVLNQQQVGKADHEDVRLVDPTTSKSWEISQFTWPALFKDFSTAAVDAAISPDGKYIAAVTPASSGKDLSFAVWQVTPVKRVFVQELAVPAVAWPHVVFNADSSEIAALIGNAIYDWHREKNGWQVMPGRLLPLTPSFAFDVQRSPGGFGGVACNGPSPGAGPIFLFLTQTQCSHWGFLVWRLDERSSRFSETSGLNPNPQVPSYWLAPTLHEGAVAYASGSQAYIKVWQIGNDQSETTFVDADAMIRRACALLTDAEMQHVSTELDVACLAP